MYGQRSNRGNYGEPGKLKEHGDLSATGLGATRPSSKIVSSRQRSDGGVARESENQGEVRDLPEKNRDRVAIANSEARFRTQRAFSHLFQGSIQKRFRASFRGIDHRLRKLRENGEVSENAYFQESDFENNLFSVAQHPIRQKDLAKIRFPASCAGI
jgi:hypothetical protein